MIPARYTAKLVEIVSVSIQTADGWKHVKPRKWALHMAIVISAISLVVATGGVLLLGSFGMVANLSNGLMIAVILAPSIAFILGYIVCWINATHVHELITSHERFAQLSNTDALTGLYNRLGLYSHCVRLEGPYCIAFFDIDHFKLVNDKYGHLAGDKVICSVASILKAYFGDGAKAARLGGEEFVVVQAAPSTEFLRLCDSVRSRIEKMKIEFEGTVINVTISIGVAYRHPREMFESALHNADRSLYEAKGSGRNRIYVADKHSSQQAIA